MPQVVHDLVDKLLADNSFYPDKSPEERRRIAWATATKMNEEGKLKGAEEPSLTPSTDSVVAELNRQLTLERYSVALYYALSAKFENMNWRGFAKWCMKASKEEQGHADKIFDYLADRNLPIQVEAVPAPPALPEDILSLFESALDHEKRVTASLNQVAELAEASRDRLTDYFLHPMISEQVEEEQKVWEVLFQLQVAGADRAALLELNHELGE